jgi:hypothetical protein
VSAVIYGSVVYDGQILKASNEAWDGFLLQLSSEGHLERFLTIPSISPNGLESGTVFPKCLGIDQKSAIYVAGQYVSQATFGATHLVSTKVASQTSRSYDIFLARCSMIPLPIEFPTLQITYSKGQYELQANVFGTLSFSIEATEDLRIGSWHSLTHWSGSNTLWRWIDTDAGNYGSRFYRLRQE